MNVNLFYTKYMFLSSTTCSRTTSCATCTLGLGGAGGFASVRTGAASSSCVAGRMATVAGASCTGF